MDQKRTVMGACEYSIKSLQDIRKSLLDYGNTDKEINWAIGGLIIMLTSNVLKVAQDRIAESLAAGTPDAQADLLHIKAEFNKFVDAMIDID